MRALLVHNDNAGTNPFPREMIEASLREAGIQPDYCAHGKDDLGAALNGECGAFDLVVAAGGDGTVADVVSTIVDLAVPIAIIPLGGSNNIARSLGIPDDLQSHVSGWTVDGWALLDRCEANGPWGYRTFVEAVGCGALTEAADIVDDEPESPEEKRRNGRVAFSRAIERASPFPCAIETEAWSWEGQCLIAEVMNIALIGSRLAMSPAARADDGLFDIVVAAPGDREHLAAWALEPDEAPCPVPARQARRVRLTVAGRPLRLDDRSPDDTRSGTVDIGMRPGPVKILTPERRR